MRHFILLACCTMALHTMPLQTQTCPVGLQIEWPVTQWSERAVPAAPASPCTLSKRSRSCLLFRSIFMLTVGVPMMGTGIWLLTLDDEPDESMANIAGAAGVVLITWGLLATGYGIYSLIKYFRADPDAATPPLRMGLHTSETTGTGVSVQIAW